MSIDFTAPGVAPPRSDLPFLRHRTRIRPPATPPSVAPVSSSLDLSSEPLPPTRAATPKPPARAVRPVSRVGSGERKVLGPAAPEVVLNRVQSGVGLFLLEAITSAAVGDLRVGCAYQLTDGRTSLVRGSAGHSPAPAIVSRRGRHEQLSVDLRQNRRLERFIVFGFSEGGRWLRWGGTLVGTTFGGARIELPLDQPESGGVTVFMSVYNVDGEFVVRSEMENLAGSVRDACQTYGFDRITWLDERTPVA